jgi:ubiquinone/menaquinone biosynthesis C-methylase UbiE
MQPWDDIWKTDQAQSLWVKPYPLVSSLVPRLEKEGRQRVLDLGCGLGRHAMLLAKHGFEVWGLDSSPTGIHYAREWARRDSVRLRLAVAEMAYIPFDDNSFHAILAWMVIYHGTLDYILTCLAEIRRCLKPEGLLICTLISTRHKRFGEGTEIEKGTYVIPGDQEKSHPHHYFDMEEIERRFRGFVLLHCQDSDEGYPGEYHWHILARRAP